MSPTLIVESSLLKLAFNDVFLPDFNFGAEACVQDRIEGDFHDACILGSNGHRGRSEQVVFVCKNGDVGLYKGDDLGYTKLATDSNFVVAQENLGRCALLPILQPDYLVSELSKEPQFACNPHFSALG
jgi:hypothetical protein